MLLVGRVIDSDRYQDEEDEERPYYLNQKLNLEKKGHTYLFKLYTTSQMPSVFHATFYVNLS